MKSLIAVALLCALVAGALFWPVGGRSFWQRADERGLPHATARLAARGLHSAWDLVFGRRGGAAGAEAPAHSPPVRRVARKPEPSRTVASVREPARGSVPGIPVHAAGLVAGPDRIVAQPAKESLQPGDRQGLEKLIRAR
jgi:hypothetical protein